MSRNEVIKPIDVVDSTCDVISVYLEAFVDITSGGAESDTEGVE